MADLLKDKVALVTGGSSGIGRATALACAREGAKVAVADIGVAGGEETAQLVKDAGGEAIFIQAERRSPSLWSGCARTPPRLSPAMPCRLMVVLSPSKGHGYRQESTRKEQLCNMAYPSAGAL